MDSVNPFFEKQFRTLCSEAAASGTALHTGQNIAVKLKPAQRLGIVFRRIDMSGQPEVVANYENISSTTHATVLQQGEALVSTPEHLMAALWAYGITHCEIEISGAEVPIFDGSSLLWCQLIEEVGTRALDGARPTVILREPVAFQKGDSALLALPHHQLRVSVAVDFGRDYLEPQNFDAAVDATVFRREMAPARTFALEEWIEPLRRQGLIQGATLDNGILLGMNELSSPLRFSNELARHKALDLLGDIALLFTATGAVAQAHFIGIRAGHAVHKAWMLQAVQQGAINYEFAK